MENRNLEEGRLETRWQVRPDAPAKEFPGLEGVSVLSSFPEGRILAMPYRFCAALLLLPTPGSVPAASESASAAV